MDGVGAQLTTELPIMRSTAQTVYSVSDNIRAQLDGLLAALEPLRSQWQSQAALSFEQVKQRWHEDAAQLNQALRSIGDGLVQSHQNYSASEQANHEQLTTLAGLLG